MSLFSSEEHVKEWAQQDPELAGETITIEQGLAFITPTARGRLDYDYAPPGGQETAQTRQAAGLVSGFWKVR